MPTYDYQCEACGESWEEFQSISEEPLRKCPHCGKPKAVRLFGTGAAVVFKGSGFYQTDYRSESYRKGEQAEKKKADSGSGAGEKSGSESSSTPTSASGDSSSANIQPTSNAPRSSGDAAKSD